MIDKKDIVKGVAVAVISSAIVIGVRRLFVTDNTALKSCKRISGGSYNQITYDTYADLMKAAIWDHFDGLAENDRAMFRIMSEMQNDNDVARLICTYKKRVGKGLAGDITHFPMSLLESLSRYLDRRYKDQLNTLYRNRQMDTRIF